MALTRSTDSMQTQTDAFKATEIECLRCNIAWTTFLPHAVYL